jgi:leucyl-tRNA synthetase
MAYQGIFDRPRGECTPLAQFTGADILGTKVAPPFGVAKEVYVLPMDGVLATKVRQILLTFG